MMALLHAAKLEATAQYIAEPYRERNGVTREQHLDTVRQYVATLARYGDVTIGTHTS